MDFVIEQATLTQAKAKMAIVGPAGSGKTFTALITAQELGNRILVIDTENGSSVKYADRFNFQVLRLPDYRLQTYIEALKFASTQDFDVVIVDSLSHAWAGAGGALEMAENAKKRYKGNKFAGWADVTPWQNKLIDTILAYPTHLIATMRMKIEYALIDDGTGKTKPQKIGLGIVQRDSFEYEFDVIAEMDIEHNLIITKTRCSALDNVMENKPDGKIGKVIAEWLAGGQPTPPPVIKKAESAGEIDDPFNDDPSKWLPSPVEFQEHIMKDFGMPQNQTYDDIKTIWKAAGYTGFKSSNATEMYNCLAERFAPKEGLQLEMEQA